jgi:sec-independent protein translocase protein TatA
MNMLIILGIVGPWQFVIIIVLALLLFGGKKIPELMRGLGQGMKEFKKATKEEDEEESKDKNAAIEDKK